MAQRHVFLKKSEWIYQLLRYILPPPQALKIEVFDNRAQGIAQNQIIISGVYCVLGQAKFFGVKSAIRQVELWAKR